MGISPDLVDQLRLKLSNRSARTRTSSTGERWLDCQCPLHDDRIRSASLNLDVGVFHCRVCSPQSSIPLDKVAQALAVQVPSNGHSDKKSLSLPRVELARWNYAYHWPNGELSHRHWRIEYAHHPKGFKFQAPSGEWTRPATYWPLYGDMGLERGDFVIVTEGEKAADALNCQCIDHVKAITAGSTQDLMADGTVEIMAKRILEVQPSMVALWPDNDPPGRKAMSLLRKRLLERHVQPVVLIDPETLKLPSKGDAADFLMAGGDLALVISGLRQNGRKQPAPRDVVSQLCVLHSGAVVWPGTEHLVKLDVSNCSSLWQAITGDMPTDRQAKETLNLARNKLYTEPVMDYYRVWQDGKSMYWRPDAGLDCYCCSAEGIDVIPDCPSGKLLAPGPARRPARADVSGDEHAWNRFCDLFGLSELERHLALAWMICCLTGQETPILLLRGYGNTGKSTLARALLGVVEPTCPEIDAGTRRELDDRQLIRTLQRSPALLLDNVSSLPAAVEDVLSRLVTEYVVSLRRLWTDDVELVAMRRAIIITTTNWDVYKGDLASRIVVCQPRLEGDDRLDADSLRNVIDSQLPLIRGYVFKQICRYYAEAPQRVRQATPWRVASVGLVLSSLGLDARDLYERERAQRAEALNANDPWMNALVDLWDQENQGGEFIYSIRQIVDFMHQHGVGFDALPSATGGKFARWVEEKQMLLRDHGFWMQRHRDNLSRGYWFRRA